MQTLDDIMSGRGDVAPAVQPPITDADRAADPIGTARRERDEQGRFARQQQDAETEHADEGEQPEPEQRKPGTVPQKALQAERQKRQERDDELATLRRELAELRGAMSARPQPQPVQQQAPQPPELWTAPEEFIDYRVRSVADPIKQQLEDHKVQVSAMIARQQHGDDAVNDAIRWLGELRQTDPVRFQQLDSASTSSRDPVGDLIKSHKQQVLLQRMGSDPEAYIAAEIERRMAEMQGAQQQHEPAPAQQRPPVMPSPFAGARSGAPRGGQGYGGPRALDDIMGR